MSDSCSPESATASFTAISACAASGMSAVRETFEKPTPLTATLHRFSHILPTPTRRTAGLRPACRRDAGAPISPSPGPREAKLRQGDVVVQFLEHDLDAPADLGL